jgi:hypothetical protein
VIKSLWGSLHIFFMSSYEQVVKKIQKTFKEGKNMDYEIDAPIGNGKLRAEGKNLIY